MPNTPNLYQVDLFDYLHPDRPKVRYVLAMNLSEVSENAPGEVLVVRLLTRNVDTVPGINVVYATDDDEDYDTSLDLPGNVVSAVADVMQGEPEGTSNLSEFVADILRAWLTDEMDAREASAE
jgi:hypothetical protein